MDPLNIVVPMLSIETKIVALKQPYYVVSHQKAWIIFLSDKFH